jgi:hypothetical protein
MLLTARALKVDAPTAQLDILPYMMEQHLTVTGIVVIALLVPIIIMAMDKLALCVPLLTF